MNDQLLVEDQLMDVKDLRKAAMDFLDNGGGQGDEACTYCEVIKILLHLIILKRQ